MQTIVKRPARLSLFVNPNAGQEGQTDFIGNLAFYEPKLQELKKFMHQNLTEDRVSLVLKGRKRVSQKTGKAYLGLDVHLEVTDPGPLLTPPAAGSFSFIRDGQDSNGLSLFSGRIDAHKADIEKLFPKLEMQETDNFMNISTFATASRSDGGVIGEFQYPRLTVPLIDETGL